MTGYVSDRHDVWGFAGNNKKVTCENRRVPADAIEYPLATGFPGGQSGIGRADRVPVAAT